MNLSGTQDSDSTDPAVSVERTFVYQRMTKFYLYDFDKDFPGHRYDCYVPLELIEKTRANVRACETRGGAGYEGFDVGDGSAYSYADTHGGEKEFITSFDEVKRFKKYFKIFDVENRFLRLRDDVLRTEIERDRPVVCLQEVGLKWEKLFRAFFDSVGYVTHF